MTTKKTRVKPVPPTDRQYKSAILTIADQYLIIRRCRDCQWPVVRGYVCIWCDSNSP